MKTKQKQTLGIVEWYLPNKGIDAVVFAADNGLSHLQISYKSLCQPGNASCDKDIIKSYGLASSKNHIALSAIALNILNKEKLHQEPDKNNRLRIETTITNAINAALKLGIKLIIIPSFHNNTMSSYEDILGGALFLAKVCDLALQYDITIASENSLGASDNATLIALVNRSNFRILLDSYNSIRYGADPINIIMSLSSHISEQIHVKDGNIALDKSLALGDGNGNVANILKTIARNKIDALYFLENKYNQTGLDMLAKDINYIQK